MKHPPFIQLLSLPYGDSSQLVALDRNGDAWYWNNDIGKDIWIKMGEAE